MENAPTRSILIVEDESHIAEVLRLNLALQGYEVAIAPDGPSGLRLWHEFQPALIVLDIMLPGIDGLSLLRHIRLEDERLPILIISAKSAPDDRIKGLAYGVDDYLAKPFNLEEFLLRVERLLKRAEWSRSEEKTGEIGNSKDSTYTFGGNRIDFRTFTAECRCGTISLTEQETRLLKVFISNRGKPLTRSKLLEIAWGYTRETSTRTIDNFIVRFRRYFEDNPRKPVYFRSLRSIGYLFDHEEKQDSKR